MNVVIVLIELSSLSLETLVTIWILFSSSSGELGVVASKLSYLVSLLRLEDVPLHHMVA